MAYNEIPQNGSKTYITEINLERLCSTNMWKCSFQTLQEIAQSRGWDVLRRQFWEEKMLSQLLLNAQETKGTLEAEKALKALRAKSVNRAEPCLDKVYKDALAERLDSEYKTDAQRLALV
jgi:biopolymer transport protein ExbB/TolQ